MSDRADRKRQLILERARTVFAEKGYKAVTMQDIVAACGISRGGLYLYYPDVRSVFLAVLAGERPVENGAAVDRVMAGDASVAEMLRLFLDDRKRALLDRNGSLGLAEYEFFSLYGGEGDELHPLRQRFDAAAESIARLIALGVRTGEFACGDPEGVARNIMYVLEGLKTVHQTVGVSEASVDRELDFILHSIAAGGEAAGTSTEG